MCLDLEQQPVVMWQPYIGSCDLHMECISPRMYMSIEHPTWTWLDRTKSPRFSAHLKYSFPFTDPLFFPWPSSSSTPTQFPGAKSVVPTNLSKNELELLEAPQTRIIVVKQIPSLILITQAYRKLHVHVCVRVCTQNPDALLIRIPEYLTSQDTSLIRTLSSWSRGSLLCRLYYMCLLNTCTLLITAAGEHRDTCTVTLVYLTKP